MRQTLKADDGNDNNGSKIIIVNGVGWCVGGWLWMVDGRPFSNASRHYKRNKSQRATCIIETIDTLLAAAFWWLLNLSVAMRRRRGWPYLSFNEVETANILQKNCSIHLIRSLTFMFLATWRMTICLAMASSHVYDLVYMLLSRLFPPFIVRINVTLFLFNLNTLFSLVPFFFSHLTISQQRTPTHTQRTLLCSWRFINYDAAAAMGYVSISHDIKSILYVWVISSERKHLLLLEPSSLKFTEFSWRKLNAKAFFFIRFAFVSTL